tara:strand:- start:1471 stop:1704 length:234 start_codon:yes stop_codon:yes gene_type:complete
MIKPVFHFVLPSFEGLVFANTSTFTRISFFLRLLKSILPYLLPGQTLLRALYRSLKAPRTLGMVGPQAIVRKTKKAA